MAVPSPKDYANAQFIFRENVAAAVVAQAMIVDEMKEHESFNAETFPEGFDIIHFLTTQVEKNTVEGSIEQDTVNNILRSVTMTAALVHMDIPDHLVFIDVVGAEALRAILTANETLKFAKEEIRAEEIKNLATDVAVQMANGTYKPKPDIMGISDNIDDMVDIKAVGEQVGITE